MKYLLTLNLLVLCMIAGVTEGLAQSPVLVRYSDTINHFEIHIPKGWFFGFDKDLEGDPTGKLMAFRHDSTNNFPTCRPLFDDIAHSVILR